MDTSLLDYTPIPGGKRLGDMTGYEVQMLSEFLAEASRVKLAEEVGESVAGADEFFAMAMRLNMAIGRAAIVKTDGRDAV